jgi:hypothetical protein
MEEKTVSCNVSIITKDESIATSNTQTELFAIPLGNIERIYISQGTRRNYWMHMLTDKNDWLHKVPRQQLRKLRHKLVSKHINNLKKEKH